MWHQPVVDEPEGLSRGRQVPSCPVHLVALVVFRVVCNELDDADFISLRVAYVPTEMSPGPLVARAIYKLALQVEVRTVTLEIESKGLANLRQSLPFMIGGLQARVKKQYVNASAA